MCRQPLLLIADDNELLRVACRTGLERVGFDVALAATGREAIEIARTRLPDLILLDLGMPGLTGRQTARVLSRDPRTAEIPIIAFSGNLPPDVQAQLGSDGFCACVQKPQTVSFLTELIRSCLPGSGRAREPCEGSGARADTVLRAAS